MASQDQNTELWGLGAATSVEEGFVRARSPRFGRMVGDKDLWATVSSSAELAARVMDAPPRSSCCLPPGWIAPLAHLLVTLAHAALVSSLLLPWVAWESTDPAAVGGEGAQWVGGYVLLLGVLSPCVQRLAGRSDRSPGSFCTAELIVALPSRLDALRNASLSCLSLLLAAILLLRLSSKCGDAPREDSKEDARLRRRAATCLAMCAAAAACAAAVHSIVITRLDEDTLELLTATAGPIRQELSVGFWSATAAAVLAAGAALFTRP
jgi:hypothetical protein